MGTLDRKGDVEIEHFVAQQNEMSVQGCRGQASMFDCQPMALTQSANALAVSKHSKGESIQASLPRCMSMRSSEP
jgi:hypothetical protein